MSVSSKSNSNGDENRCRSRLNYDFDAQLTDELLGQCYRYPAAAKPERPTRVAPPVDGGGGVAYRAGTLLETRCAAQIRSSQ